MFNGYISVILWWIAINYGWCTELDVGLHHKNSGYFIKPLFHGEEFFTLNKEEKPFVITQNSRAGAFEAQYGPFHVHQKISGPLLQASLGNQSTFGNGMILEDLEISAHLVSRTVTQERPLLQVLFHASQYVDSHANTARDKFDDKKDEVGSKWCMQIHVEKGKEERSGVCVLGGADYVCIADVSIPLSWWLADSPFRNSVTVYYSVYSVDSHYQCSRIPNEVEPLDIKSSEYESSTEKKSYKSYISTKRLIKSASLTQGQLTYQELKEDQHILIYMPQKSFYPGSKFRVPVKLQVGSDLDLFVIRVRAKRGLSVVGAESTEAGRWHITLDVQSGERRGSVTARLTRPTYYTDRDRIQEVFDWIFEVDDTGHIGHEDDDSGRLILILEYQTAGSKKVDQYAPIENKVVAKVQIQHDDVYSIVPVIKTEEVINTAVLTGETLNYSMHIYSVGHQNSHIAEITKQTTCHSGDEAVLKVSQSCDRVYLDGSETKGSSSVSVIAKYGRHSTFLFFRVWVPETPLAIELSDPKLSQIKSWKALPPETSQVIRKARIKIGGMLGDEEAEQDDSDGQCGLKYQQSIIEVYARFYIPDEIKQLYLVHRKALFRVTDLVKNNLRVADQSVAMVIGNVVHGLNPGRTEVQVMSRLMRPIGAKEIRVGSDKVAIKQLLVKVVSGVHVDIVPEDDMPGTLAARIIIKSALDRKFQEAMLDISVEFYDGTVMPLDLIPDEDYFLDLDTKNDSIVVFVSGHAHHTPQILYMGPGKGNLLKIGLELGDQCHRRKSRPLIVSNVYVENLEEKPVHEQPVSVSNLGGVLGGKAVGGFEEIDGLKKPEVKILGPKDGKKGPINEAQQQPMRNSRTMSPLEIGMYVLLGVFVIAILIFAANCIIFMARYRKKKNLPKHKRDVVSNANDWIWIGRDTLERNAINTGCNQALMSEQDFTVNKNVSRFLLPTSNPSSNRSSCATNGTVGGTSATGGGGGSNRNSIISTYKGSECSIRITPNPISDSSIGNTGGVGGGSGESNTVPRQRQQQRHLGQLCRPPLHTFHAPHHHHQHHHRSGSSSSNSSPRKSPRCSYPNGYPALSDIQSTSAVSSSGEDDCERGSCSSLPSRWSSLRGIGGTGNTSCGGTGGGTSNTLGSSVSSHSRVPTPSQQARFAQVAVEMAQRGPLVEQKALLAQAAAQIAEHEEDVANGNLTDSSVEWDYEAMGMTYEQLMEYFDNLKESIA